jgi:hypothetical protein
VKLLFDENLSRRLIMRIADLFPGSSHVVLEGLLQNPDDRDTKFCSVFRATLAAGGIKPIQLPARRPNLNAYAERWVRSAKEECLSKLILFGEASLRRALTAFIDHYHQERNHQGKNNVVLFAPAPLEPGRRPGIHCRERLGGLLRYYSRAA